MTRTIVLAVLLLVAASASGAHAQADRPGQQPAPSPGERLQEGAAAIVDGLRMLMDQLQSYQPPEVLPNGDIIIRRRPPAPSEPAPKPDESAPGDTGPRPL